ncbi:MAG: hypothetical protein A3K19_06135 [Lentisphaerae bacterium RIFOXYB12_FULL_65_16]|nr:MAG: hypothetical protein A3K18_34735 [Lentisphaerae bacterium RIFOXYA12_64_32]OGV94050.1 MAG: hypothetical protein A3K19_06135 [Lentisphaerae bacterium RIFOXYB12_FULL_65_16]
MTRFVIDTSVAVAWYLPEVFTPAAREWQRRALEGSITLLVPSLHYWEFANVLRTYVRRGELDAALATEIWEVHLDAPLVSQEPERGQVLGFAFEYQATAYDAVYLALSLTQDAPLVTAERTTTPWVVKLGDRIRSVRP